MKETILANGIRVLTEAIPGVRSASVGIWILQGSAHETDDTAGASHLLEHMVFKGTERRTARDLALALEGLGGSLDAYTSREHTSYQARVLDEHLGEALDVLADLTLHPLLRREDLQKEREVILEEIATVEDTPDDLVFELHGEGLWQGHPYGRSILGTPETVTALSSDDLTAVHETCYVGRRLLLAAAGNVEHDRLVEAAESLFGGRTSGEPARPVAEAPAHAPARVDHVRRPTAQTHVVFGSPIPGRPDPRRYPLLLLSAAFGGGMSSRLFQRIREELALAYTVYSYQSFHARAGLSGVYVGTRPGGADAAVAAVREEFGRLCADGLGEDELEQIKQQVKGQFVLSLESTSTRLYRLVHFALNDEPYRSPDELLRRIDAVTREEVADVARTFYDPDLQYVLTLGP